MVDGAPHGEEVRLNPFFWTKGNRDSGYRLMDLFGFHLGGLVFRVIAGRYPEGACQPPHVDVVHGYEIYRAVFVLKQAQEGGELYVPDPIFEFGSRFVVFNPKFQHQVMPVITGVRYSILFTLMVPTSNPDEKIDKLKESVMRQYKVALDQEIANEVKLKRKSRKKSSRVVAGR